MSDRPEISKLEKNGFSVRQFSPYHYRINDQLDLFANEHNRVWRWRDSECVLHGMVWPQDVHSFVPAYLKTHPKPEPHYVRLGGAGWWVCPMPDCDFRIEDDGSSKAEKAQSAHLEGHP